MRQEFVIVGFTRPAGSRIGLGALLLGVHDDAGALRYCGKVGTGFSHELLARLRKRLGALEQKTPSVVDPPRAERLAHWVKPELVAEVAFTEWTRDGRVRHPAFLGLRSDKPASAIRVDRPVPAELAVAKPSSRAVATRAGRQRSAPPAERAEVAGVRLSHPGRVYFPDLGVTKSELAQYYEAMAERALPALAHRPLSLLRCPDGADEHCFFQKHIQQSLPSQVGRVVIEKGEAPYATVKDLAGIVSLVQIAALELHVWGSRADKIESPDLLVFDLDPDSSVPWRPLADTARVLRALLADLGLVAFLRTTGGKGLHVVVPIQRRPSWAQVKTFTHAVATRLVRELPERFTAQISKQKRKGKILIDYLRNQRGATAIGSYSVRARPGAPVAMPIDWEELDAKAGPPLWNLREARARLRLPDPWRDFEASRRPLTAKAIRQVALS
jgi:bifunctional non-homologous end joining protein LigD